MKVCFLSHTAGLGGAERSLLDLVGGLTKRGATCWIILPKNGPLEKELIKLKVPFFIHFYDWWTIPRGQKRQSPQTKLKGYLENGTKLARLLAKKKFDILVTNSSVVCEGAIAARILRLPHVWHIRELGEKDHGFVFKFGFNFTAKFINQFSDLVIFNSKATAKEFNQFIDRCKQKVVYNSVAINSLCASKKNKLSFRDKNSFKLIMASTISEKKGQVDAIKATVELRKSGNNVELLMIGNCRNKEFLENLKSFIRKSGQEGYIHIMRFIKNPYPVIKSADAVLVCSQNEAFGRIILEGMLLNKPVIATNRGGIPEIIKDGRNGFLYEPKKYPQLASKILLLIKNSDLKKRVVKNGHSSATKRFSEENYSGKIFRYFTEILKEKTQR